MAIFGSYLDKKRSLAGESLSIVLLDTCVALMAGLIVIPSCFAFGVEPDAGPGLVFITLPNIFTQMAGGRIWGSLFFLFLFCAALSTIVGVFENIVSFWMDLFGWKRTKAVGINILLITVLSIPCILGFSVWSGFQPLGAGTNIMDLEDFIVSNNILPLGSVVYLLFCTHKNGWGWKNLHSGSKQRRRLKVSGKSSLLYDTYPAVGRSRDLSERLLRHVPPAGNDYFCDLDADRTGLSWIYRIYFQQPEKTEKIIKKLVSAGTFSHCRYQYFFVFYLFSKRRSARIHIACTMIAA